MKDKDRGHAPGQDGEPAPAEPRKPYAPPRLRCFGDIREITQTPVMSGATGIDMATGNLKS